MRALLLALALLLVLGFDRSEWQHWIDADGDCQSTRQEVLIEESLVEPELDARGCKVLEGLWRDPYTGRLISDPKLLDIDHLVPLREAWEAGGWAWDDAQRRAFANDLSHPEHLVATHRRNNRAKGAKAPQDWMPPDAALRCTYLQWWWRTKVRWHLRLTPEEAYFIFRESGCEGLELAQGGE